MSARFASAILLAAFFPVSVASAQGLATSSTVGGHNTVQQAPSGGTTSGAPGAGSPDSSTQGQPTVEERKLEQHDKAASEICKGC